ncbi:MAG: hypothetical protein IT436_10975 [Phycisphaerales bacterium]|nr:hypothetical protein [Phycisphaerales bacterium]
MLKFLFGGGWWTAWYAVVWLGGLAFVGVPVFALIRDAVPKPAGPASLGSVVFAMAVAVYFGAVTPINTAVAARMAGLNWLLVFLVAGAACAGATVASYMVLAMVCEKGGYARSAAAAGLCIALFMANLAALGHARGSVDSGALPDAPVVPE